MSNIKQLFDICSNTDNCTRCPFYVFADGMMAECYFENNYPKLWDVDLIESKLKYEEDQS